MPASRIGTVHRIARHMSQLPFDRIGQTHIRVQAESERMPLTIKSEVGAPVAATVGIHKQAEARRIDQLIWSFLSLGALDGHR